MVVMKRVRIEEFFLDFDKLRKGHVHTSQVASILSMLNFTLSREEFQSLADRYSTGVPNEFNYKAFCASINSAFTTYGIQKHPQTVVSSLTNDNTLIARKKYLDMSPDQQAMIQRVLGEYSQAISIRRLNIKQMCQDFDITKNQHITKHQFLRILTQCQLTCPPDVLNLLLKTYCDKGNADEVNYFDFCNDVDSPEMLFGVGRGYNHSFEYYPKTRPRVTGADIKKDVPNDCEDVLAKLRQVCKEQRIRINEFFRDFDKLRSGHITQAQFRIGLNMAKIVLSGNEFHQLCDRFCGKDVNQVLWKDFSDSVDQVFTKKHLEKDIDIQLNDVRTQSFYGQAEPNKKDMQNCSEVVEAMKVTVQKERLDAKSFFQDQDRHNHFKVSPKQFKQILTLLKVDISDAQLASITKVLGNKEGKIEYLRFLDQCNVLKYTINEAYTGAKSTYKQVDRDFTGLSELDKLMNRIKEHVKRYRIRLGEFFQDHDPLRKGTLDATKFRTTLYAQKLQLTTQEYTILEDAFRDPQNAHKVNYFDFNEILEEIFTEKDLEKCPQKTLSAFKVPSILDARNDLSGEEEAEL
jgi:Ca2+-binding EF-hand superfamily protein